MKPYPAYKDSGLPWLGPIPEHWGARRLKYLVSNINEQKSVRSDQETYIALEHIESGTGKLTLPDEEVIFESNVKCFHKHDVLFSKLRPYLNKVVLPEQDGVCVGELLVLRGRDVFLPRFLQYCLLSKPVIDVINGSTFGSKMPRADWGFIGNLRFQIPDHSEQASIVAYLDRKTANIEHFITKKLRLIALLNDQKAAIINQAVTKGLNPDVPMKDSGVEWLGEVPAHWEVRRLRFLAGKINSGVTPAGGATVYQEMGVPFLRSQNVHFDGLRLDDVAHISESIHQEMAGSAVKPNDVLLNITGASIGRCCCVPEDFGEANVNQHVCIIRTTKVEPRFLANFLSSAPIQRQIRTDQNGASREGLNYGQIKEFFIALPPETEQASLISYIEAENAIIGKAINRIEREIELIQDYRTTLISDAVTGKIDVREAESLTT